MPSGTCASPRPALEACSQSPCFPIVAASFAALASCIGCCSGASTLAALCLFPFPRSSCDCTSFGDTETCKNHDPCLCRGHASSTRSPRAPPPFVSSDNPTIAVPSTSCHEERRLSDSVEWYAFPVTSFRFIGIEPDPGGLWYCFVSIQSCRTDPEGPLRWSCFLAHWSCSRRRAFPRKTRCPVLKCMNAVGSPTIISIRRVRSASAFHIWESAPSSSPLPDIFARCSGWVDRFDAWIPWWAALSLFRAVIIFFESDCCPSSNFNTAPPFLAGTSFDLVPLITWV